MTASTTRYTRQMRAQLFHVLEAKWGGPSTIAGHDAYAPDRWKRLERYITFNTGQFELPHKGNAYEQVRSFIETCTDGEFDVLVQGVVTHLGDPREIELLNRVFKGVGIALQIVNGVVTRTDIVVSASDKFGLLDHNAFQAHIQVYAQESDPISVLFLDLDNFKSVNDNFSHAVGDQVIREAAEAIKDVIRRKGNLFHRSGDEMLVVLPNFTGEEAAAVAERIREAIEERPFSAIGNGVVTTTIGIATYPKPCSDWRDLETCADKAAMEQKKLAKNALKRFTA